MYINNSHGKKRVQETLSTHSHREAKKTAFLKGTAQIKGIHLYETVTFSGARWPQ